MNSNEIYTLIEAIAANPSKNDKQAAIKEWSDDAEFVRVLEYAYNPFKTFGIQKLPVRSSSGLEGQFDAGVWDFMDKLIAREISGNDARDWLQRYMDALSAESAELLGRILRKNLRADFSESTINKAIKGTIPDFPYMRCSLPKDAKLDTWPWEEGVLSQEKADGMFANIDHEVGGLVRITSRQGSEFPIDKFDTIVKEVRSRLHAGHQNHGEIIVMRLNEVLERQIGNGMLNSVLSGGDFDEDCRPVYLLWDQIPLSAVVTKGKHLNGYIHRLRSILTQLKTKNPGDSIALIQTKIVKSLAEGYAHAAELMKKGKEGTVIKHPHAIWKDGTSNEQIKLKLEFEVDLKIVGIVPGKDGGKNEGRPGSFSCETDEGNLLVDVTVKNEAMRLAVEKNPEDWIGRIIAVTANDIMKPGESNPFHSLFLPRMSEACYRTDKILADGLDRVFAQKEAAIFGESLLKEAA